MAAAPSSRRQRLRHRGRHVEGELGVGVAMFGAAHAGDARDTRQAAWLGDEASGVAGRHHEAGSLDGACRTGRDAGGITTGTAVTGRRQRRQRAIDHHQRAVGPPCAVGWMNLKTQRSRPTQPRRASDPLKRNERLRPEGEINGTPHTERIERFVHGVLDDATGVTVEGICRAVSRLDRSREPSEERRPARADDERTRRTWKKLVQDEGRSRGRRRASLDVSRRGRVREPFQGSRVDRQ
jgi:hypothetical protein